MGKLRACLLQILEHLTIFTECSKFRPLRVALGRMVHSCCQALMGHGGPQAIPAWLPTFHTPVCPQVVRIATSASVGNRIRLLTLVELAAVQVLWQARTNLSTALRWSRPQMKEPTLQCSPSSGTM